MRQHSAELTRGAIKAASLARHKVLPEPELLFDPINESATSPHPLRGLIDNGPLEKPFVHEESRSIRIAALEPSDRVGTIDRVVSELSRSAVARERSPYLPDFPSLQSAFGMGAEVIDRFEIGNRPNGYDRACQLIEQSLTTIHRTGIEYDAVYIHFPVSWEDSFSSDVTDAWGLHDFVKAVGAKLGIPTQIITDDALNYSCRASVLWHLSLALFAKAGGTPWLLDQNPSGVAHIGIEYAVGTDDQGRPSFITCCSQVFDGDGTGLQFVLYRTPNLREIRRNPFLSRPQMRAVISRSLDVYRDRHGGRSPDRVVIQKGLEFSTQEIDGCFDSLESIDEFELLQIVDRQPFRGIKLEQNRSDPRKGVPAQFPITRGSMINMSRSEVLLWTSGNSPVTVGGGNYFQERREIPSPVLLRRWAGVGSMDQVSLEILGLTKMDWNSDNLYSRLPVTLRYAQRLARNVKNVGWLRDGVYDVRMFM